MLLHSWSWTVTCIFRHHLIIKQRIIKKYYIAGCFNSTLTFSLTAEENRNYNSLFHNWASKNNNIQLFVFNLTLNLCGVFSFFLLLVWTKCVSRKIRHFTAGETLKLIAKAEVEWSNAVGRKYISESCTQDWRKDRVKLQNCSQNCYLR